MRGLSRTQSTERALAALATRQHGVVARSHLIELGIGEDAIEHRLRLRRLRRLHRGVYSVGHGALTRQGRWLAGVLSCGEGAVLSHWSAAELWGIRPGSREMIDVTLPRRSHKSPAIRRHYRLLSRDETTMEDGIPVTTVPRTIFDLAAAASVDVVENALREAEFRR